MPQWLFGSLSDLGSTQDAKKKGSSVMSSIALLNHEGTLVRKLQLVYLPDDYVVPEGMIVSWRMDLRDSSRDPLASLGPTEPIEASFCFGEAWGQVYRAEFQRFVRDAQGMHYGVRDLTITVQGTSAGDVMRLRDHIMHLIHSGATWGVSNDLNPTKQELKPGILQGFKKMVGMAQ